MARQELSRLRVSVVCEKEPSSHMGGVLASSATRAKQMGSIEGPDLGHNSGTPEKASSLL